MWDTEKLVQPLFSKYSQFDILRHLLLGLLDVHPSGGKRGSIE